MSNVGSSLPGLYRLGVMAHTGNPLGKWWQENEESQITLGYTPCSRQPGLHERPWFKSKFGKGEKKNLIRSLWSQFNEVSTIKE